MDITRRKFLMAAMAALAQSAVWKNGHCETSQTTRTLTSTPVAPSSFDDLVAAFFTPPHESKPGGYWWWFNTLMNREGITRDLTEFRKKGISEVLLVNSAAGLGGNPIPSGPPFLSQEWFDLYKFALAEAQRNEIKIGFNLCAGWCMGGPWIEKEESGRWFLQSKKEVTGPARFSEKLPLPGNRDGYNNVKNPPGIKDYIDLPLEELDYRDTAVTAIRLPDEGSALINDKERLTALTAKSNRLDASNWTRATVIMEKPLAPFPSKPADAPIAADEVVDLTDKMTADGYLEWDVPAGKWVIIRTGHRMTGSRTMLGLPEAEGLSIDWLNRRGVDAQFEHLGMRILEASKPYIGNTLIYFADDSFEDGFPNWTDNILEQFEKYRGYDATPYLPVLAGYIIGSAEISDRFLHDYRKTVADLLADEHYTRFMDLCHEQGLLVQNESAGPSRSGTMCMDGLKNLGRSDLPMGEFWLGLIYGQPEEENPKRGYRDTRLEDGQNKVTKMVASGAHIYGKNLVSAESFTSFAPHWADSPASLKYAADRAFCEGVNRMMIHTTTGTRPQDGKPGYEYGAGTHFNPNVTWWDQSGAFLTYLGRCQYLLRQGLFVADVLYYNGDWAPNLVPAKHTDPDLGKGYDYDVCNEEVLLTRLSVKDGSIVLPDGMSYRLLVLPDTEKMPLPVLKKIAELVSAGAVVIGPKPQRDPGLNNYPECDAQVAKLANDVWGESDGESITEHTYGKGRIYWGVTPREVLQKLDVVPDLEVLEESAYIDFIHRSTDDAEIYFILNRSRDELKSRFKFRVTGKSAFLFHPVSGTCRPLAGAAAEGPQTVLQLELQPREAYFIVFPAKSEELNVSTDGKVKNFPVYTSVATLEGPWTVEFDEEWGGPESTVFPDLVDWSQHEDDRIRFFSGSAVYKNAFDAPSNAGNSPVFLDLGTVNNIADVTLNGKHLGTVWTSPWRIELSDHLKPTDNKLEIKVTNLWPNRLIGDAALPAGQRLTNTNIEFKPDDPLLPSGLLGPVRLLKQS